MSPDQTLFDKPKRIVAVVCACLRRSGGKEILLGLRRAPEISGLDMKWELPGGKIEFGETPEEALVREIREELGFVVRPVRLVPYLHTNTWEYERTVMQIVLACYECEILSETKKDLGTEARWFHVNEIDFRSTLPGTKEFLSLILKTDWFDGLYIRFDLIDPATNKARQFGIGMQETLFSRYGLIKYWGRIGATLRVAMEQFDSPGALDRRIVEIAKKRLWHGYRITELQGSTKRYEALEKIVEFARKRNALTSDISDIVES